MRLVALLLLAFTSIAAASNSYMVTVPQKIRPGSNADICLTSLKPDVESVQITAWLQDMDNNTLSTVFRGLSSGLDQPQIASLKVPKTLKGYYGYKIRVKSTGGIVFDKTAKDIGVTSKTSSIFIQLDRPKFKPGDLVQFRAVGTNPALKVLDDPLDITIQDPKRNRVKQFMGVKPVFGVFAGSFQLSSLTTIGGWTIKVKQGREEHTKSFSVEKYVLPKFEVNIVMPPYELKTDKFFTATISAMYTFGKPVDGDVELTIRRGWYRNGRQISKKFRIKGKATIRLLMSELGISYQTSIHVSAKVTERITGNVGSANGDVTIYNTPEKVEFSSSMPSVFKPGLPYNIVLRLTQRDDKPLKPPVGKVNITATYSTSENVPYQPSPFGSQNQVLPFRPHYPVTIDKTETLWTKLVQIPESGIIEVQAEFPADAMRGRIKASYRGQTPEQHLNRAESPSKNYIYVAVKDNQKAEPGKYLPLIIKTTEEIQSCNYKILSKGSIQSKGTFQMKNSKSRERNVMIHTTMAPQAQVLVYYTRPDGEIVADAISISIEEFFANEVTIKYSKHVAKPGDSVDLQITADAKSLVSVLAVDKSILLMQTGNDITTQDVLNELQQYGNTGVSPRYGQWDYWWPRPYNDRDAFAVFNGAGVYVLTDALLFQRASVAKRMTNGAYGMRSQMMMEDAPQSAALSFAGGGGLASPTRTRKNFPETWLWQSKTTSNDGRAIITTPVPDTITQWITSAFAVNPVTGLGVASELANLTTYQNFFMRFDLPYSAIRGEVIIVQITVFNYHPQDLEVSVKLNQNGQFSFADKNGDTFSPGPGGWTKKVTVVKDSVGSVYFPIKPTVLGKIVLSATARSALDADAVEKEFLVEPEGIRQTYNVPLLVDLQHKGTFTDDIQLSFPPNVVSNSEFIKIQAIGDIMGPALTNLDNLLKTSYGSGEANMVTFAPNVYVSSYLKATNRLSGDIKDKVESVLEGGYQRQLSFIHYDGSFSAFGTNDVTGSTWITAFVVKSFAQASEFTFIDKQVMTRAIKWLLDRQIPTGEFEERGMVIQKEMQGGTASSKRSLAAFVLIALLEARSNDHIDSSINAGVNAAIRKTTNYIAEGAPASIANLYELAIVFYALTLVNHPSTQQILSTLETKAVEKDGEKFWILPKIETDIIQPWKGWQPPETKVRALDVETTCYILLGYNKRDDTTNGIKVLKWLSRQRNSNGGFISTQDTVIAVQALSGLGKKLYVPTFEVAAKVKSKSWPGKTFDIKDSNSLVLQNEDIPNNIRTVSVQATGKGMCLMQSIASKVGNGTRGSWVYVGYLRQNQYADFSVPVTWINVQSDKGGLHAAVSFHVLAELREPAFNLTTDVLKDSIKGFRLRTCFSWKKKSTDSSTMALLEIQLPSGMEADLDSLDTAYTVKKSERAFRQINLFFESIHQYPSCIEVNVNRVSLVARHQPVPIRLTEISEPSNEAIVFYQSKALANASIIEVCGEENCYEAKK